MKKKWEEKSPRVDESKKKKKRNEPGEKKQKKKKKKKKKRKEGGENQRICLGFHPVLMRERLKILCVQQTSQSLRRRWMTWETKPLQSSYSPCQLSLHARRVLFAQSRKTIFSFIFQLYVNGIDFLSLRLVDCFWINIRPRRTKERQVDRTARLNERDSRQNPRDLPVELDNILIENEKRNRSIDRCRERLHSPINALVNVGMTCVMR